MAPVPSRDETRGIEVSREWTKEFLVSPVRLEMR